MTKRMTDERLAEIEVCHVEVEPIDITDTWFYFEELPGYTTEIAHKQRGELLQALKAERARLLAVEESGLALCMAIGKELPAAERRIAELQEEVERLRSQSRNERGQGENT